MRMIGVLCVVVAAAACGPRTEAPSLLKTGHYVGHDASLSGASLDIDVTAKTATFTPSGGSAITWTLTAVPEASWPSECPTNARSTVVEEHKLSPDPLTIGSDTITSPLMQAGCGVDGPDASHVTVEGRSGVSVLKFSFDRR